MTQDRMCYTCTHYRPHNGVCKLRPSLIGVAVDSSNHCEEWDGVTCRWCKHALTQEHSETSKKYLCGITASPVDSEGWCEEWSK